MTDIEIQYNQALDYLYSFVDYSLKHISELAKAEFNLDRMFALMEELGDPQKKYPIIHVAGTKGKGSVAALCASALKAAGYKTGLYTSPHLWAEDISRLAALQAELLAHAVELVRPGGLLVWCTCSLEPEEGERQIDRLLASAAPVERIAIEAGEIGGLEEILSARGEIRSLPCHLAGEGGIDGFHIARLRRRVES